MRASAVFIAVCMVVIAGSIGIATYLALALSAVEAAAAAAASLSGLAAYQALSGRAQERAEMLRQITLLSRGTAELARQVGDLGRRVIMVEAAVAHAGERARASVDPLHGDIDALGQLIKQIAESVAAHETALTNVAFTQPDTMLEPAPHEPEAKPADDDKAPEPAPPQFQAAAAAKPQVAPAHSAAAAAGAPVTPERLDLYLQPIVTMPQRKVRYYEVLPRLRAEDEAPFAALKPVTPVHAELPPQLGLLTLQRSLQIAGRLSGKNRELAVFSQLSRTALDSAVHFPQTLDLLADHRALAPSVFLGIAQTTLRNLEPVEQEALSRIVALGFRLSLEDAADLRLEPRQLAAQGFRFVKVAATALLAGRGTPTTDIHPSDLANLLQRYGIDLIASQVESEGMVVDLLDYDVGLAQGLLFSAPRPVRPEVFDVKDTAQPTVHAAEAISPASATPLARRRDPDLTALRPASERNPPGLAKLARTIMRRA